MFVLHLTALQSNIIDSILPQPQVNAIMKHPFTQFKYKDAETLESGA
jgi:hypothetical protein